MVGLYKTCCDSEPIRVSLKETGHPQPPPPLQTDNKCACGLTDDNMEKWFSNIINMRSYWVRDHVCHGQPIIYLQKGANNLVDNFTKHHTPTHHQNTHNRYSTNALMEKLSSALRGFLNVHTNHHLQKHQIRLEPSVCMSSNQHSLKNLQCQATTEENFQSRGRKWPNYNYSLI